MKCTLLCGGFGNGNEKEKILFGRIFAEYQRCLFGLKR
jgi:hypothetical protein